MKLFARILLGALFCASAISKLSAIESFDLYIFSFQFFSFDLASLAARFLIIAELLLGLGLMSGFWRRTVNWCCVAMLGALSAFLVWRWALGDNQSCHCFGDVLDMNPWQSLLKNAALALILAIAWKAPSKDWLQSRLWRSLITAAVSIAATLVVFLFWTPGIYWRLLDHHTNSLVEEKWQPYQQDFALGQGREAVLFVSPICEHCQHCVSKVNTIVNRHDLDGSRIHLVFMTVTDDLADMDTLIPYYFEQAGIEDPGFSQNIITYDNFLPMTDGKMPLVCLFEDGTLTAEYSYSTLDEKAFVEFLR